MTTYRVYENRNDWALGHAPRWTSAPTLGEAQAYVESLGARYLVAPSGATHYRVPFTDKWARA